MLKIRLARSGKKHGAHYKVVVLESRSKRDGKTRAQIGHWHPSQNQLVVNKNAYDSWIAAGALPSRTVRKLLTPESPLRPE